MSVTNLKSISIFAGCIEYLTFLSWNQFCYCPLFCEFSINYFVAIFCGKFLQFLSLLAWVWPLSTCAETCFVPRGVLIIWRLLYMLLCFDPHFWDHVKFWPLLGNCKCRVSTPIFIRILHFDLKLRICCVSTPQFYECRISPLNFYRVAFWGIAVTGLHFIVLRVGACLRHTLRSRLSGSPSQRIKEVWDLHGTTRLSKGPCNCNVRRSWWYKCVVLTPHFPSDLTNV